MIIIEMNSSLCVGPVEAVNYIGARNGKIADIGDLEEILNLDSFYTIWATRTGGNRT